MSLPEEERPEKEFGNDFFQAKLKHVYAQVSPQAVILCLFVVAIVFIPLGAATIIASDAVFELDSRYDLVHRCTYADNQGVFTANGTSQGCSTNVKFTLDKALIAPIYIYYRLKGFNQNYRLYAKSLNEAQLSGSEVSLGDLDDCSPKKSGGDTPLTLSGGQKSGKDVPYVPCGQIAWSMFNDTISLYRADDASAAAAVGDRSLPTSGLTPMCLGAEFDRETNEPTSASGQCRKRGIAFSQDVKHRLTNSQPSGPSAWTGKGYNGSGNYYFDNGFYDNEPGHRIPIVTDEDFMVWSRIATLSDFRKLYRVIEQDLPRGDYVWHVDEFFDTTSLDAEKHIVLATRGWIGGKNHVLGALYLTMGSISLVLAFGFIGMYITRNKE